MKNNTTIQIRQIPENVTNIREFLDYDKLEIKNQDDYYTVSQHFSAVKKHLKMTEDERVKITGPINQSLRNVNDLFKRISDPLTKISKTLTTKMAAWTDSQRKLLEEEERKKRAAEKAKFEADAKAAKLEAIETDSSVAFDAAQTLQKRADAIDTQNVEVKQTVRLGAVGTVAERRTWTYKITDPLLVPRPYLIIDEKSLNYVARQIKNGPVPSIPGVEFYQETSFSALR